MRANFNEIRALFSSKFGEFSLEILHIWHSKFHGSQQKLVRLREISLRTSKNQKRIYEEAKYQRKFALNWRQYQRIFAKYTMRNFAQTKNSSEFSQNLYTSSVWGTTRNRSTCFGTKCTEVVGPTARKSYLLIFPQKAKTWRKATIKMGG